MIKQIDRVISDLKRQVEEFEKAGHPICVAVIGVNHATSYTSFEGLRSFATNGTGGYKHPSQEAARAIDRLERLAKPSFDEFLILRFVATNVEPFPFAWVNESETLLQYSALLTRISNLYETRFGR